MQFTTLMYQYNVTGQNAYKLQNDVSMYKNCYKIICPWWCGGPQTDN